MSGLRGRGKGPEPPARDASFEMSVFDPELIVFDLDGTLAATVPDIAAALNQALAAVGLPGYPEAAVAEMIGGGEETFLRRALGPDHQVLYPEVRRRYLEHYAAHLVERTRLYPGVQETLAALAPRKLAVLSNKLTILTQGIVTSLGLAPFFQAVRGGDSYGVLKPASQGLTALIRELGGGRSAPSWWGTSPGMCWRARGRGQRPWRSPMAMGTPPGWRRSGPMP